MKQIACLVFILVALTVQGQEFKVAEFAIDVTDLTARTQSRVDRNGRKCAVLKVYVPDKIVEVRGSVIGEIVSTGLEKQVYVTHDSKQVEVVFENYFPMRLIFDDYGYPTVSEQMVYRVKLMETAGGGGTQTVAQTPSVEPVAHTPAATTRSEEEILKEAEDAFKDANFGKAIELYKLIPENTKALLRLAYCYTFGIGVPKNESEAAYWTRKAADLGDADAQSSLGTMYLIGQGVPQSYSDAINWSRKAAKQGNAIAMNVIAQCYEYGNGVKQNYKEAANWYKKAAEHGDTTANYYIGKLYEEGLGVSQSESDAVNWYRKGAENGDYLSICELKNRGLWKE